LEKAAEGSGGVTIPGGVMKNVDIALQDMVKQAWWFWVDGWS